MTTSREIRKGFLDFFREKGHEVLPSGPLAPPNDPTLMFANAGMVQFKDVFTGKDVRPYKRATTSQKCMRVSGKHNDLENVGVTARHHTFFEMLGNFSFGDYFKKDAIEYAWELLVGRWKLDPQKLVITVFGGEPGLPAPADDEAAEIWKRVSGFGDDRIFRLGAADNFWMMGDTGPCGPCSEVHYWFADGTPDLSQFGAEPTPDGSGWVELWNNVFMQFERHADGGMVPLPAPSIDTGMGLERVTCVLQNVRSNYDTDLLRPLVELTAKISGKTYGGTLAPDDVSMRVIADHARAAAFLIAEGVFPDRDGKSYVLRRVMRRAIRHGHRLGIERLFLHEVALAVCDGMGDAYPELRERRAMIEANVREEEDRFRRTLKRGLELLSENTDWREEGGKRVLPGRVAFVLYDTHGFPLDLQDVIGAEQGFAVDHVGFEAALDAARALSSGSKLNDSEAVSRVFQEIAQTPGGKTTFVGYDRERADSTVTVLVKGGARVERLVEGEEGELITALTPFYGESGGQVGDRGEIRSESAVFCVEDTHKPVDGLFVHRGRVVKGTIAIGEKVALAVDHALRSATRRNHSATHLLHWALRTVLGPQAMQKGSLVGPDRLRFDYSASRALTPEELTRIEDLVNEKVLVNAPIETEVLAMDEAKKRGAIGIFEEKYGDVVRMLTMTRDSIELCGGTHASRTGDIGLFKILSEGGIAAGVRRIEAATGANALHYVRELEGELERTAVLVKGTPRKVHDKVERLVAQQKELQREIEALQRKLVSGGTTDLTAGARDVGGVRILGATVDLGDAGALRELADKLRDKLAPAVILLGGRGGGRPDFAQAGAPDATNLPTAIASVYEGTGSA